jgi:hypothetical protein
MEKSLIEQIKDIDFKLEMLKLDRIVLMEKLNSNASSTFRDKLLCWLKNTNLEKDRYIPDSKIIREWIVKCDFDRNRTIDLVDFFYDEYISEIEVLSMDRDDCDLSDVEYDEAIKSAENIKPLLTEIINLNLGSITIDW